MRGGVGRRPWSRRSRVAQRRSRNAARRRKRPRARRRAEGGEPPRRAAETVRRTAARSDRGRCGGRRGTAQPSLAVTDVTGEPRPAPSASDDTGVSSRFANYVVLGSPLRAAKTWPAQRAIPNCYRSVCNRCPGPSTTGSVGRQGPAGYRAAVPRSRVSGRRPARRPHAETGTRGPFKMLRSWSMIAITGSERVSWFPFCFLANNESVGVPTCGGVLEPVTGPGRKLGARFRLSGRSRRPRPAHGPRARHPEPIHGSPVPHPEPIHGSQAPHARPSTDPHSGRRGR